MHAVHMRLSLRSTDTLLERFADGSLRKNAYAPSGTSSHWAMLRCMWLHLRAITDRSQGRKSAVDAIFAGGRRARVPTI